MFKHLVIISFSASLLLNSCKCNSGGNDSTSNTSATTSETTVSKNTTSTTSLSADSMANGAIANDTAGTASVGENDNTKGKSLYKNGKSHARSNSGTPGFFPEGSDRLLTERDLKYLSDWGMAVITNEIYARHGMIFNDGMLGKHFKSQKWYHPTSGNVENKLTKMEKENLEFIKNYKAKSGPAA